MVNQTKFVAFGESLFRSVTNLGERLSTAQDLGFYLGGTELNVAANLASLAADTALSVDPSLDLSGVLSTRWVSCLPSGPTGDLIRDKVEKLGVDVSFCQSAASSRVGWYLMESGAAPRPDVVFHRNSSAMADEKYFSFDWPKILADARVFHTSGVTCGLSETLSDEIRGVIDQCEKRGVLFSYDLNYRKNIWSLDESVRRQKHIVPRAHILFCSNADLRLFFGDDFENNHYSKVFENSKIEFLVMSQRSPDQREYSIEIVTPLERKASKRYLPAAVDRVGVGDAAAAGFFKIFLRSSQLDLSLAAEWAALNGALKYGIKGDMALTKVYELERILLSPETGIVR